MVQLKSIRVYFTTLVAHDFLSYLQNARYWVSADIKYLILSLTHFLDDMHYFLDDIFLSYFFHYPLLIYQAAHNHQICFSKLHSLIPVKSNLICLFTYSLFFLIHFFDHSIIKAIQIEKLMNSIAHDFKNDFRIILNNITYKSGYIFGEAQWSFDI